MEGDKKGKSLINVFQNLGISFKDVDDEISQDNPKVIFDSKM